MDDWHARSTPTYTSAPRARWTTKNGGSVIKIKQIEWKPGEYGCTYGYIGEPPRRPICTISWRTSPTDKQWKARMSALGLEYSFQHDNIEEVKKWAQRVLNTVAKRIIEWEPTTTTSPAATTAVPNADDPTK
jgi:hypothetical protein